MFVPEALLTFVKSRTPPEPGSIPAMLGMFENEIRFDEELADSVTVRTPNCYRAELSEDGTLLELEDLSSWKAGADPVAAVRVLAELHQSFSAADLEAWPWLWRGDTAADAIGALFDTRWEGLRSAPAISERIRTVGDELVGRVPNIEKREARHDSPTLIHGDASFLNMRTSASGELALLDWEDVRIGDGTYDVAWMLVSSVEPTQWNQTLSSYDAPLLSWTNAFESAVVQGLLTMSSPEISSAAALGWVSRLERAIDYLERGPRI